MAKITLPSYIKEGHGRMDDAVIVTRNGESYMKVYKKILSNSANQLEIRQAFKSLVADWKYLTGIVSESWNFLTKGTNASGYNAFIGANILHRRAGDPLELCPGLGEEIVMNLTAAPGGTGQLVCSFLPAETGRHITFFARKDTEPGIKGVIIRFDAGADPVSPYTITGLEPGAKYSVYAVATDAEYEKAKTVSQSSSSTATAGN